MRVIQKSVGFIAIRLKVIVNGTRFTDSGNKLSRVFVSEMGKTKINIYAVNCRRRIFRLQ